MAVINFPPNDTPSTARTLYTINEPWTDPVNGGEWWFSASKVRWLPVVAGGASDFADLGGLPSENAALDTALDLKAPLASPTFTGTVTGTTYQATTTAGVDVKNSAGVSLLRVGVYDATTTFSTGVAEGTGTASGSYSHAEGTSAASGDWSHAEGKESTASGAISHAEGYTALASGSYSHAAGTQARAIHTGARVMTDSEAANCDSAAIDSCTMRYAGGYRFLGGAATFSGAIGGTTGVFSGAVTAGGTNSWTGSVFSGAQAFSGAVAISDATASTTTTTGALKVTGGIGVGGAINAGAIGATTGAFSVAVTAPIVQAASGKFQINTNASGASGAGSVRFGGGTINTLESWGGTAGGALYIYSEGNIRALIGGSSGINLYQSVYPDNTTRTLGLSTFRWGTLFGTSADLTGTIKTVAYLKATAIATSHATAIAAGDGAQAYISDDDKPVWSNGTVWKLADGTTLA